MRKVARTSSISLEPLDLEEEEEGRLSTEDWEWCINDDCASWEIPCLVQVNQRSPQGIRPRPTLIRVQYFGKSASFDPQNWDGLIETIEDDFERGVQEPDRLVQCTGCGGMEAMVNRGGACSIGLNRRLSA